MISIPFKKLKGFDKGSDECITLNNLEENSTSISNDNENNTVLTRTLTCYDGLNILIGIMVGSGIFASPVSSSSNSSGSYICCYCNTHIISFFPLLTSITY